MTRIISILSGKGGTGKTFLTTNLGICLAEKGEDVTVLDGNLTTPNLGLHLGVSFFPTTMHDVLKGKSHISDSIYYHDSGLKVVPASIALDDMKGIDSRELPNKLLDMLGGTDLLLIDAAAGLGRETLAAMEASDEILLVINPELTSVTDALKAAKLAEEIGTHVVGAVVNRRKNKTHQLTNREISSMLENVPILGEIEENDHVQKSISKRTPMVKYKPYSKTSKKLRKIAARLVGEEYEDESGFLGKFFSIFR